MTSKAFHLKVRGKSFVLTEASLASHPDSLLAKCLTAGTTGFQAHAQDDDGAFVFDRDPVLFEHVVLPMLRTGLLVLDEARIDPFAALQELDYFCLLETTGSPQTGLTSREAVVLCKLALDRLVHTFAPNQRSLQLLLFAEDMDMNMVDVAFDVGLFTTVLANMFRSLALTGYQMLVRWEMVETEVRFCSVTKSFRVVSSLELVHAYTHFDCLREVEWSVVCVQALALASYEQRTQWIFTTPNRYLYECREGAWDLMDVCPLRVHVRMCYDLLQKCTAVDIGVHRLPTEPWQGYLSYVLVLVASPKGTATLDFLKAARALSLQDLEAHVHQHSQYRFVTYPPTTRIFQGSCTTSLKNERFSTEEYDICAVVLRQSSGHHERLVTDDPTAHRRRLFGNLGTIAENAPTNTRVVDPSRVRRVCRMQLLTLSTQ